MKLIDITGQRFGRLTVVEKATASRMWRCLCDCGNETVVIGGNLRKGGTTSCGCVAREWSAGMGANKAFIEKRARTITKHGNKRRTGSTVEYKTWLAMKRRCYDSRYKDFPNWGGRGIKVCDRWKNSFENFLLDMGKRPDGDYSIDRIDPNKDYSSDNCRWATIQQQGAENRRGMIPVVVDGVPFASMNSACKHFGVGLTTAFARVASGIPVEEAVSNPNRLKSRRNKESYMKKSSR